MEANHRLEERVELSGCVDLYLSVNACLAGQRTFRGGSDQYRKKRVRAARLNPVPVPGGLKFGLRSRPTGYINGLKGG